MPPQHLRSSTFRKKTKSFCRQKRQSLSAKGLSLFWSFLPPPPAVSQSSDKWQAAPQGPHFFWPYLRQPTRNCSPSFDRVVPYLSHFIDDFFLLKCIWLNCRRGKRKKDILLVIHDKNYAKPMFLSPDMLFPRNESLGSRDDHVCPVRAWSLRLLASVRLCNKHQLWSHRLNLLWGHSIYIHVL